jgi:hypothetical protein
MGDDHIPSSCMVITVHVVKGRQYSAHIQSWRWNLRPTLDLESDKSRRFNHADGVDSTVKLPKFMLVGLWTACYI